MSLSVNSQPSFSAANNDKKNEQTSPYAIGFVAGGIPGGAADFYFNSTKAMPNKYSQRVNNLADNFAKIASEVEEESHINFENASGNVKTNLDEINNKKYGFIKKYFENEIRNDADDALRHFDGITVNVKESASEETKKLAKVINEEITKLGQIGMNSAKNVELFSKKGLLKALEQQKWASIGSVVGLAAAFIYKTFSSKES